MDREDNVSLFYHSRVRYKPITFYFKNPNDQHVLGEYVK